MSKTVHEIDNFVEKLAQHDEKDQRKETLLKTILAVDDDGEQLHSFSPHEDHDSSEHAHRAELSPVVDDTILQVDQDNRVVTPSHFLTLSNESGNASRHNHQYTTDHDDGDDDDTNDGSGYPSNSLKAPTIEQLRSEYEGYNDSVAQYKQTHDSTPSSLLDGIWKLFSSGTTEQQKMVRIRNNKVISLLFATFASLDYDKTGKLTTETAYRQFLELYFTSQIILKKRHEEGNGDPYDEETWEAYKDEFGDFLLSSAEEYVDTETYLQLFTDFLLDDDVFAEVLEAVLQDPDSIVNKRVIKHTQ